MKIRILIADDHALIRECIAAVLELEEDLEVVGHAEDGFEAVQLAHELLPDLVLMDISMKGLNGIDAARAVVGSDPQVKVLMLSMYTEKRYVLEALNAGASGFLLKSSLSGEIIEAIHEVAGEGFFLSEALKSVVGQSPRRHAKAGEQATLTERERQILSLLAQGRNYREIAQLLRISAKTVETHRAHIMKKLEVKSIAELTKYAIREGLLVLQ